MSIYSYRPTYLHTHGQLSDPQQLSPAAIFYFVDAENQACFFNFVPMDTVNRYTYARFFTIASARSYVIQVILHYTIGPKARLLSSFRNTWCVFNIHVVCSQRSPLIRSSRLTRYCQFCIEQLFFETWNTLIFRFNPLTSFR